MHIYQEEGNIDKESGYLCHYEKIVSDQRRPHRHEYFEFFIVTKGKGIHNVNGQEQTIVEGDLFFVRDFDVHDYKPLSANEQFEFVNLAFSSEALYSMLAYLGQNIPSHSLLNAKMPPHASLLPEQRDALAYAMLDLDRGQNPQERSLKFRVLLVSVFSKYFLSFCDTNLQIPAWLSALYGKMKKPENFILGTARLFALAGKSREHVCRAFTKHYGITPSEFILDLRLTYSASLLKISNLSVTDVCFESGFENMSWFYKAFGKRFGVTPRQYREQFKVN